ncbi:hypothetical protein GXW82_00410 [Streptacidiphilus sp. 4-A2]|nr:hypothetical protein [Streptacidiphilus sp. 4-A2]
MPAGRRPSQHARRLLAETAAAQPVTGWNIAMAFQEILHMIAWWEVADEATVAGIN